MCASYIDVADVRVWNSKAQSVFCAKFQVVERCAAGISRVVASVLLSPAPIRVALFVQAPSGFGALEHSRCTRIWVGVPPLETSCGVFLARWERNPGVLSPISKVMIGMRSRAPSSFNLSLLFVHTFGCITLFAIVME